MECDYEVGNLGAQKGEPLNEEVVDSWPGGIVPDGTWDDGGFGGACHTNHYLKDRDYCVLQESVDYCDSYNTYHCNGSSHAEDLLSGHYVWIMPSCDYETVFVEDRCMLNDPLAGNLEDLPDCLDNVACTYCSPYMFLSCGADGTSDVVNFGQGGGHFPSGPETPPLGAFSNNKEDPAALKDGVPYPTHFFNPECYPDAVAATYVFASVEAKLGSVLGSQLPYPLFGRYDYYGDGPFEGSDKNGGLPGVKHSVVSTGWIDWTAGQGDNDFSRGTGLKIDTGLEQSPIDEVYETANLALDHLPECMDTRNNDWWNEGYNEGTDIGDPDCHTDGDRTNALSYAALDDSESE